MYSSNHACSAVVCSNRTVKLLVAREKALPYPSREADERAHTCCCDSAKAAFFAVADAEVG